jgi:hypothetical protein
MKVKYGSLLKVTKYYTSCKHNNNTSNQTLVSLTSIYLQFTLSDVFQPHGAILSGSVFGSKLHDKMF